MTQQSSEFDRSSARRSLELAKSGIGLVSPNPLVGCVIVSSDGQVVGEGTYIYRDIIHAEAIALQRAGDRSRGGTAYVSLEPHCHFGKTPPCTDALINAGIVRVVCPMEDPNPLVSGRGFDRLREAGIEVVMGILAEEAAKQNEKFICWHTKHRPFVHLKLAMSLDGRISMNKSVSTALSGDAALRRVHEIRHEHDAILIGGNTALVDNPSLTDRSGKTRRRPLVRVILENRLRLPVESTIATTAAEIPTIVFTSATDSDKIARLTDMGISVVRTKSGARDLAAVLNQLKEQEIQSVLVEGGTGMAGAFCDARLVDKVTMIISPLIIGGGTAPNAVGGSGATSLQDALRLRDVTTTVLGDDIEITGYPS